MAYDFSQEHLNSPVTNPGKSWRLALFLSASLGFLAIDRFYIGKIGTGILHPAVRLRDASVHYHRRDINDGLLYLLW